MSKMKLLALIAIAIPFQVFAVDGVVVINQSTVLAAGGFPYVISQPGSYKLSGNLTSTLNQSAILIAADNVSIDLNGFRVTCAFDTNYPKSSTYLNCIGGSAPISQFSISNGSVAATQTGGNGGGFPGQFLLAGVGAFYPTATSSAFTFSNLRIDVTTSGIDIEAWALTVPLGSIVRDNILRAGHGILVACPGVLVENVNFSGSSTLNGVCVKSANVGL